MTGQNLLEALRLSGTGEAKLAFLRGYLDTHPKASAEELLDHLEAESERPADERHLNNMPNAGKWRVTCAKAREILNGTLPVHEMDPANLIVAGPRGQAGKIGPERLALLSAPAVAPAPAVGSTEPAAEPLPPPSEHSHARQTITPAAEPESEHASAAEPTGEELPEAPPDDLPPTAGKGKKGKHKADELD